MCVCHSSLCHWSVQNRRFHGEICLLSDGPYLFCESCSFCTDRNPGEKRCKMYQHFNQNCFSYATFFYFMFYLPHLITLQRTFPVKSNRVGQALTAATAAPHGRHVIVKERTVICKDIIKRNMYITCQNKCFFLIALIIRGLSPLLLWLWPSSSLIGEVTSR